MADEQAPVASEATPEQRLAALFAADANEASTAPEGPEAVSASDEQTEPEQPEQQEEVTAEDSGFEEVELDGETYKLPPKLKEAVLRQSDYTRKTQELAEHRKLVQQQIQAVQLTQAFQSATEEERSELKSVEAQLAQYKDVKWGDLDSDTMMRARVQLDTLRDRANELRGTLGYKEQEFKQRAEQMKEQFRNQRAESLQRLVPGWNQQADVEATRAALEIGFTPNEIKDNFDARLGLMAWKAGQFDKLQSGKAAAVQQVKKAPPVIKPGVSQGQNVIAQKKYVEERARLKKSGSVDDAARLFMRMK